MTAGTKMLSPKQAAERLGLSPTRVRALIAAGALHATNIGIDRPVWAIEETELARFAALSRPQGRPTRKDANMRIGNKVFASDESAVGTIVEERTADNARQYRVEWFRDVSEWMRVFFPSLESPAVRYESYGMCLTPIADPLPVATADYNTLRRLAKMTP